MASKTSHRRDATRSEITTTPTSYRAVSSVEAYDGSEVTHTTEEIEIRRPFDGRVFIRDGEPPGGAVRFQGRSTFARYANYAESGAGQVAGNAPTVALGDLRLAGSLEELVARGLSSSATVTRRSGTDARSTGRARRSRPSRSPPPATPTTWTSA